MIPITKEVVDGELHRLRMGWSAPDTQQSEDILGTLLDSTALEKRDQLAFVVRICLESTTLSEAGRKLFDATREKRKVQNDADRLRKYLARFNLDWARCKAA
ncbi:MAG TPA: hypothetical protein VIV82_09015 [Verrucomicrobiae bacterium]